MRTQSILLAMLLAIETLSYAQAQENAITWKGEVRVRGEMDGRDFQHRTPMNAYTLLRARLAAEIIPTSNVQLFLQLQDSRLFGQPSVTGPGNTSVNLKNLDLRQGYLRLDSLFQAALSLTVGRMELLYGNQRIIGAGEWANVGRAFDGALLRYRWQANTLDLFSTNVAEYNAAPSIATPAAVAGVGGEGFLFSGLYYSGTVNEQNKRDAFLPHEWSRKSAGSSEGELSRVTFGAYGRGTAEQFLYEAEAAYQAGNLASKTIGAYLFSRTLGYKFENSFLASVSVSYDVLSGSTDTVTFSAFYVPFATGHKWHGFMDYFINIPDNTFNRGLQDMIVKVVVKPSERSTLTAWFHNFAMTKKGSLTSGTFGQELDLVGAFSYNKNVSFEAGFSTFLPGSLFRASFRGADAAFWAYATTRVWF